MIWTSKCYHLRCLNFTFFNRFPSSYYQTCLSILLFANGPSLSPSRSFDQGESLASTLRIHLLLCHCKRGRRDLYFQLWCLLVWPDRILLHFQNTTYYCSPHFWKSALPSTWFWWGIHWLIFWLILPVFLCLCFLFVVFVIFPTAS